MLDTLPERVALARREQLDYPDFLQIILTDEVGRREHRRLELRLRKAGFEQVRRLLDAACSLQFLDRREHVLLVGPVGVGKSFLAQALGYAAVRAGHTVRYAPADRYFREMAQARVDRSVEECLGQFDDPILAGSALDGLANVSYQIVIEGESYRLRVSPHRALLKRKEVLDPPPSH